MNKFKMTWALVLLTMASAIFPSCLDDDNENFVSIVPNALVTLKTDQNNGLFYLQLDDSTTLVPTNMKQSPYGNKEVRAFVNFSQESTLQKNSTHDVHVNWIDSIRTKDMDMNLGETANAITYKDDPLEIVNDWVTVAEDGYLTLRFRTYFGLGTPHYLRLVRGENPYEITLYHDANGDHHGQIADGYIAFRLNDVPGTEGETVELTLKWNSFSGEKSAKFKYRIRH